MPRYNKNITYLSDLIAESTDCGDYEELLLPTIQKFDDIYMTYYNGSIPNYKYDDYVNDIKNEYYLKQLTKDMPSDKVPKHLY